MLIDKEKKQTDPAATPPPHYYGDTVRALFVGACILMVATMAYFADLVNLPPSVSVIAVIVLVLLSALESPKNKNIAIINTGTAALGFGLFQYQTVSYYLATSIGSMRWAFFIVNQVLALIFLAAFYYSSKTVRAWKQIELKQ